LVDLANVKVPLLHAVAEFDHIVPYQAAKALIACIGSEDKTEEMMKGGHVSLVAGKNAVRRLWPRISEWLGERSQWRILRRNPRQQRQKHMRSATRARLNSTT
jgi:polyhydroxyalkanoate synthase